MKRGGRLFNGRCSGLGALVTQVNPTGIGCNVPPAECGQSSQSVDILSLFKGDAHAPHAGNPQE